MKDGYGRNIDYVRISVTDRCNLRCIYCMPEEGIPLLTHADLLNFDEIYRLCRIFSELGIHKVKITGGEPLVRRNVSSLIKMIKDIDGIDNVTLTTNGTLLKEQMSDLYNAGIDGINLSLDTMDAERFEKITRLPYFAEAMEGFREALKYPQISLKINCVPLRSCGRENILKIAALAKEHPVHVRFIEMMPIGCGSNYQCFKEEELQEILSTYGELKPYEKSLGNGPGRYYELPGFRGKIGFISAVSHQFCDQCNRFRLTSRGALKTCLQYKEDLDLREYLRNGYSDEAMMTAIKKIIMEKPKGHHFGEKILKGEQKCMFEIGG